jgi:hypothetical protein
VSGGRHPPAKFPESAPHPAPQGTGHPGPEHCQHPFPQESNLYVKFSETFSIALNETATPVSWCEDLQATCLVTPDLRTTVWDVLRLPEFDISNPDTPQGMIAPHLKRNKAELVKLSRKFSSKESDIQSLEAFKAKGDVPPTLRIPLPRSMQSTELINTSAVSY